MSRNVDEAFEILISHLKHSESETAAASSHRGSIEARLQSDFSLTRLFRSGSFGHGTSLSVVSDIDYFAVMPTSQLKKDSSVTLRKIKEALAARFPNTGVHVDSPAVVVPFANGSQRHEIIPADFVMKRSGHSIYDIPNRYGEWMRASPSAHNSWVNVENKRLDGKLKQLIRLIKYWNYVKSVGLRSFYIELRVTEYAKGEKSIVYKYDVKRALNHISTKGLAAMQDPQGISGYVYPCSQAVKESALSKLSTALGRSTKALEADGSGNISMAYYWWNKLYDGNFPGYY